MNTAANNLDAAAGFFTPAANTKPFLKVAAQGFAGSGKTYTLACIAIELVNERAKMDPTMPRRVAMVDSEKAAGFLRRLFDEAKIELVVKESRTLTDVIQAINLCESGYAPCLIIDSLSHIWESFVEAYKTEKKRNRLEMLDWGVLKPKWKSQFSDRFVRSRVDIMFTGRAGYEYDSTQTTDDTGKKRLEIHRSGIKMKVEGETAYEPDLILHMERFEELLEDEKQVYRQCTVLKDRSGFLDGKTLKNPSGPEFQPVITYLLSGAAPADDEPEGNDRSLFTDDDDTDKRKLKREILLEKIEETIREAAPGQSVAEKSFRQALLKSCLGTLSWREVTVMALDRLERGLVAVEAAIANAHDQKKEANADGRPFDPEPAAPAARGKKAPATDGNGAEVAVIKPMSDVERERARRGVNQKLNGRGIEADDTPKWLSDQVGRAVESATDLTDAELRDVLAELSTK